MAPKEDHIDIASSLPIFDAAAYLWFEKSKFADYQNPEIRDLAEQVDPEDMDAMRHLLSMFMIEEYEEKQNAKEGPVKRWLELSHPTASEEEISTAIEATIKLEEDINKFCSEFDEGFDGNAGKILSKIFRNNSSFGDKTRSKVDYMVARRMFW